MPAHSETAGSVILQEAFALSKMHDSSGWNGLLRDKTFRPMSTCISTTTARSSTPTSPTIAIIGTNLAGN